MADLKSMTDEELVLAVVRLGIAASNIFDKQAHKDYFNARQELLRRFRELRRMASDDALVEAAGRVHDMGYETKVWHDPETEWELAMRELHRVLLPHRAHRNQEDSNGDLDLQ